MCGGNAHNAINRVLFIRFAKDDCAWIPPGELNKLLSTYKRNKQEIRTFRFPQASIVYRFVFSLHLLTKKNRTDFSEFAFFLTDFLLIQSLNN